MIPLILCDLITENDAILDAILSIGNEQIIALHHKCRILLPVSQTSKNTTVIRVITRWFNPSTEGKLLGLTKAEARTRR